jgi:DNA-directed RNA polymerase subunit beta
MTTAARKPFSRSEHLKELEAPNLVQVQLDSYNWFLKHGFKELLRDVSPVEDWTGNELELAFMDFRMDEPKYTERQAMEKNVSYEAPLKFKVILKNKRSKKVREQELFVADLPLMTPRGTFIINGVERVVISQLIRSPGTFFQLSGASKYKRYFGAKLIPSRGAWLEFETESNGVISARIDRKRKVPATALLRAFGISSDDELKKLFADVDTDENVKFILATILQDPASNEEEGMIEVYKRIRPGDPATMDTAKQMIHNMFFNTARYDLSKVGRHRMNPGQHRPFGQPPSEDARRTAAGPPARGILAHGAHHQGPHVHVGHRVGPAQHAHQQPPPGRGAQGILLLGPAVAVHGPAEPAV